MSTIVIKAFNHYINTLFNYNSDDNYRKQITGYITIKISAVFGDEYNVKVAPIGRCSVVWYGLLWCSVM